MNTNPPSGLLNDGIPNAMVVDSRNLLLCKLRRNSNDIYCGNKKREVGPVKTVKADY